MIKINWYNPFIDINTQDIWPQQEVSNQANNSTTKTLLIQTNHSDESMWNGITTQLYSSDFDQSQSKYLDIWINANYVNDDNMLLHIDIGYISEDMNNNGLLDTEDEDVYGERVHTYQPDNGNLQMNEMMTGIMNKLDGLTVNPDIVEKSRAVEVDIKREIAIGKADMSSITVSYTHLTLPTKA